MGPTRRILVANELASYRESIAAVFRFSLPHSEVSEATSADLDREVVRLRPDVVICSRLTSVVEDRVPVWVELYPDGEPASTFCGAGGRSRRERVELSDLLAVAAGPAASTS